MGNAQRCIVFLFNSISFKLLNLSVKIGWEMGGKSKNKKSKLAKDRKAWDELA